ncbi:hypothetical protein ACHAXR_009212 [Thalassiosira sp. AJA248-18]
MVLYGQIIIGAPGAGKTTYCNGMQQYLKLLGRECYVVNLDPANEVPPTSNGGISSTATAATMNDNDGATDTDDLQEEGNNSQLPYETILDVCNDVISLDSVMSELSLGPNGGLLYCMEYIEHHLGEVIKILKERLGTYTEDPSRAHLLFDLPGQIELTAHSNVISRIAQRLVRELDLRLVCVQLVDAAVCLPDVSKFIGATLVCTASMMRLELPCVNVLSKMDLLQGSSSIGGSSIGASNETDDDSDYGYADDYGTSPLPFNLEYFTQCHDLRRLVDYLDSNPMDFMANSNVHSNTGAVFDYTEDAEYQEAQQRTRSSNFSQKYRKLHNELCDVVEDFGLLSFLPLSIQDAESVGRVVARVDKCNGYVFLKEHGESKDNSGSSKHNNMQDMFSSAMVADSEWATGILSDVQEKYLGDVMFHEDIAELGSKQQRGKIKENGGDKSRK